MDDGERVIGEEAIIQEFLAPLAAGFPGAFGLKDDCALLVPEPGCAFVLKTDPVIEGVHFPIDEEPDAVAWKALAVNVSDLVAKGAKPFAYLMALALPDAPQRTWLAQFQQGLNRAQNAYGCHLVGGDTDRTPGPLTISITGIGSVPAGKFVRRATAAPGDLVYVTGTIGDAALGLRLRLDPRLAMAWGLNEQEREALQNRYRLPNPPLAAAGIVSAYASASADVSDGLVKDFDRLCRASAVSGWIEAMRVPVSPAAEVVLTAGGTTISDLITGGEDYEILMTVPLGRAAAFEAAAAAAGVKVTCIGGTAEQPVGATVLDASGTPIMLARTGWDHF